MVGSNIQLFAIGPQDFHLTANPQTSFFKTVFRRHTNFSLDTRRIHFSGETPNNQKYDRPNIQTLKNDEIMFVHIFKTFGFLFFCLYWLFFPFLFISMKNR